jgi:hypothetical protein
MGRSAVLPQRTSAVKASGNCLVPWKKPAGGRELAQRVGAARRRLATRAPTLALRSRQGQESLERAAAEICGLLRPMSLATGGAAEDSGQLLGTEDA